MPDNSFLSQITRADGPYPGLRAFDDDEAEIFFGREAQTDQLLEKLQRSHFIAVVGPSGCGKSSLVRAGMIAALESGFLSGTGTGWRIAEMRPGDRPLARLTDALLAPSALGPERGTDATEVAIVQAMLRRGPLGLVEILRETPLPQNSNLLLLVDQFEEVFRFRNQGSTDEADAFVALLLATVAQREAPVYVVITMRSDFLGDCALFTGLPEAINGGQYLTPRLSRDQIRAAITGPARVFGGDVDPTLVSHLLNEIGPDPDQLPLMQHAMMRMWTSAHNGRVTEGAIDPSVGPQGSTILTMADYEAIGSLSQALSRHADSVLASMTEKQQQIARAMLTRLTERGADKRDTRRPTRLDDIAAVAGATDQDVIAVAEQLRQQGCSFLTPPPPVPLTSSTVLDIGHESLIRQWRQLYQWVEAEAVAATRYRHLAERADLHAKGEAGLMTERELSVTLEWHQEWRPNAAWAGRYHPGFEAAEAFLRKSRAARTRRRLWRIAGSVGAAVLIVGMTVQWVHTRKSKELAATANAERVKALVAAARDSALADTARAERARAVQQRDLALVARAEADSARREAEALNRVLRSQAIATIAKAQLRTDPDSALSLAIAAFRLDSSQEAKGILQQALIAGRLRRESAVGKFRAYGSPDGQFVAIPDSQGSLRVWETATGRQVAGPLRLEGPFNRAVFSPHGEILAVLTDPGRIILWDTRTWRTRSTLQGRLIPRQFPSLSYDAKYVLAWGADQHPRIWETATGEEVGQVGDDTCRISAASFSPNGKYLLAIDSIHHAASLWNANSREYVGTLAGGKDRPVLGARFSPDSRQVLLTPVDNRFAPTLRSVDNPQAGRELQGVDTVRGQPTAVGPPATFPPLASFNPNGRSILAVSGDVIRLWRSSSDRRPILLKGSGAVRNARFSQDGRLIVSTGGDGTATLWDVATGENVGSFSGGSITGAWLSADSRQLLTTSEDGILREWSTIELGTVIPLADLPDKADPDRLEFDQEFPAGITPNGKYLLARAKDGTARIWEVSNGRLKSQLGENTVDRASLSPDGRRAITSAELGAARVWDVETGTPVASLEGEASERSVLLGNFGDGAHPWVWYRGEKDASITVWSLKDGLAPYASVTMDRAPNCVTVSPDAAWLVTCEEGGEAEARVIHVRQLPSGGDWGLLRGHTGTIIDVFFSRDGRFAASTSYDKTAIIWEVGTWRAVAKLSGHESGVQYAFFSPDSRKVVTIDDNHTVRVWGTETGIAMSELRGHTDLVKAFAFSGDGQWLVTGSEDNTARVWDTRTGEAIAVLYGHTGPVIAVGFVQGSKAVVTASADGTIRTYNCDLCVPTSVLLSLAERRMDDIRRKGTTTLER